MSIDESGLEKWEKMQRERGRDFDIEQAKGLQSGDGGGTFGGMDGRISKLEDAVVEVKVNIATLAERIAHLPSKGFVFAAMSGVGATIVIVLTILGQLGFLAKT